MVAKLLKLSKIVLQGSRDQLLWRAGSSIAVIAVLDWQLRESISLGFLYLFPMMMVGECLSPLAIAVVAFLCTGLTEAFDPFPVKALIALPRLVLSFAGFFGTGVFVWEAEANRRNTRAHLDALDREVRSRRNAEERLNFIITTSPAAILTADQDGVILMANRAAEELLSRSGETLRGKVIGRYFPSMAELFPLSGNLRPLHTSMECRGQRSQREIFQARMWFSTYRTEEKLCLAAVISDVSEELRDREEFGLEQALSGSRIIMQAMGHEIRNISAALSSVMRRSKHSPDMETDRRALETLIDGLQRLAHTGLRLPESRCSHISLTRALEDFRIIIEPDLNDAGIETKWDVPRAPCLVWAEHHTLLQSFLNIAKNSRRALEDQPHRMFEIEVSEDEGGVIVRFCDSGPGVTAPELLFQPFQAGAEETGLGLYLSRMFIRSFGGELTYEPRPHGSCFAIRLWRAKKTTETYERSSIAPAG